MQHFFLLNLLLVAQLFKLEHGKNIEIKSGSETEEGKQERVNTDLSENNQFRKKLIQNAAHTEENNFKDKNNF